MQPILSLPLKIMLKTFEGLQPGVKLKSLEYIDGCRLRGMICTVLFVEKSDEVRLFYTSALTKKMASSKPSSWELVKPKRNLPEWF